MNKNINCEKWIFVVISIQKFKSHHKPKYVKSWHPYEQDQSISEEQNIVPHHHYLVGFEQSLISWSIHQVKVI